MTPSCTIGFVANGKLPAHFHQSPASWLYDFPNGVRPLL